MQYIQSRIWLEEPEPDNPFAARAAFCHGYDVYGEMIGRASWADMIHLLFKGEAPSPSARAALDILAVALANPGPREPSVHAAMCGGVGGSVAAASLMAALAVGAGSLGGAREVALAMEGWRACGKDLEAWRARWTNPPSEAASVWASAAHPVGFDPHGASTSTPVRQTLARLSALEASSRSAWLLDHLPEIEKAAGQPLALTGVAAAALADLGFSPQAGDAVPALAFARSRGARAGARGVRLQALSVVRDPTRSKLGEPGRMSGPRLLEQAVGRIRSRVGAVFIGSHAVFRGKDLHADLGDAGWFDLYVFGITGRRFSAPKLRLLEAMWTYTSYPDSRIWNNRVAALAGTTRSTGNLGVTAALAVSEAKIYGHGATYRAIEFLVRLRAHLEAGGEVGPLVERELSGQGSIGGYGRPVAGGKDERIEPLLQLARSLRLSDGSHLKLAYAVDEYLSSSGRTRHRMNCAGFVAGLSADIGLSPREHYFFLFPAFLAGIVPCYMDAAERAEGTLLPLPCDGVAYVGVAKRRWTNAGGPQAGPSKTSG